MSSYPNEVSSTAPTTPTESVAVSSTTATSTSSHTDIASTSTLYRMVPLIQRSLLTRLDVGPFGLGYMVCILLDYYYYMNHRTAAITTVTSSSSTIFISNQSIITVIYALLLLTQICLVLLSQWYISIRVKVGYHIMVHPQNTKYIKNQKNNNDKKNSKQLPVVIHPPPPHYTHCFVQPIQSTTGTTNSKDTTSSSNTTNTVSGGGIVPILYETMGMVNNNNDNMTIQTPKGKKTPPPTTTTTMMMKITYQDRVFRCPLYIANDDVHIHNHPQQPQQQSPVLWDDRTLWYHSIQSQLQHPHQLPNNTNSTSNEVPKFRPMEYPIHLPISFYTKLWKGHVTLLSARIAQLIYGPNTTLISLPTMYQLLQQQLVQPLFIFQLLCILLWCCDEYWYYAIYTLCALILLECTLSYTKLKSLQRLHTIGNRNVHQKVYVRRGMSRGITNSSSSSNISNGDNVSSQEYQYIWMNIYISELLPGDIISLSVHPESITIPADIVLLHGTAVCDEALLTGESIPQRKQPLIQQQQCSNNNKNGSETECLDINDMVHKESILFGGTTLLVSNATSEEDETISVHSTLDVAPPPPPPPDQGIIGMVLRTGFDTTQGNLLRTMVHSTSSSNNNETHNTMDTFVFISLLLFCAIVAAMYVLSVGWHDERRNHFRLILHVIMIITSVVPPELPMELSLAITNSVSDLIRRCHVYCTGHYRIPYAGQVNICCFDKTGTLTSDEMQLKGVRVFEVKDTNAGDTTIDTMNIIDEDNTLKRPLLDRDSIPWTTLRIMAACHSLAAANMSRSSGDGKKRKSEIQVIGDPLELAVLRETGYHLIGNNVVEPLQETNGDGLIVDRKRITILHRFAFSSKLKRMTVLCTEGDNNNSTVWAISKGAPETMKELLSMDSLPINYDAVAFHHMGRGRRVLAMAYRDVGTIRNLQSLKDNGRDTLECNLLFAGFLVLDCPLKSDSKSVISDLKKSGLGVVMITGDAILTAAEVARQVGILRKPMTGKRAVYEIRKKEINAMPLNSKSDDDDPLTCFECVPLGRNASFESQQPHELVLRRNNIDSLRRMTNNHEVAFCISGDVLVALASTALSLKQKHETKQSQIDEKSLLLSQAAQNALQILVPIISVFARHAPHQKEAVVAAFNAGGYRTLMCGDGTNDVGALKRAHVGISIISAPNVEKKQRNANANLAKVKTDDRSTVTSKKSGKGTKKTATQRASTIEESLRQLRQAQDELDQVELGDASVAAPFTSRAVSIKCCKDVIQQGRCTLVTMLQIYKILGINCLVNAFVLSELFLHGVKQGDRQLTILGLVVASLFYFVTRAEPLPTLSSIQPPASVLCSEALLSIAGQCIIHIIATAVITECALSYVDPFDPSLVPDGPFNPNVLNTCTFLITCVATINTFAVNYYGRPYMKDVHENKLFYRTIQMLYGLLIVCSMEVFIPLNDLLQLTSLPNSTDNNFGHDGSDNANGFLRTLLPLDQIIQQLTFSGFITVTMIVDTILSFTFERTIRRIYTKTTS